MKILLINDNGTATGGAELQMLALRQNLRDRGHDARLFTSSATPVPNTQPLSDYTCFGINTKLQAISQAVNPFAYWQLRRILSEFQPDVVHVRTFMWQLSPLILPLLKNIPCLYQTAIYKAICPVGTKILPDNTPCQTTPGTICLTSGCLTPQSWIPYMMQRQLWLQWQDAFDLVVALSYGMKAKLEAEGITPVEVVHNGVPERPPRPKLTHPPTVAFAGRLIPEKGVDVLLQAFAQAIAKVPEAQLLIAGQGVEETPLRTLAKTLNIDKNVTWLGHLSRPDLEKQFDRAWVQVIPSLWEEPFGNVTTEAMMRGTAVIASAVGAQPEIIGNDKSGFLVPPNDVDALTEALIPLLLNQNFAEEIGQAGRQRAIAHFSETRRTENFLNIYQRLQHQYQSQSPEKLSLI